MDDWTDKLKEMDVHLTPAQIKTYNDRRAHTDSYLNDIKLQVNNN